MSFNLFLSVCIGAIGWLLFFLEIQSNEEMHQRLLKNTEDWTDYTTTIIKSAFRAIEYLNNQRR